jgi:hypothetical protein
MRMILASASFALLAACGGGGANNSAGNAAAASNGSAATAPAPASSDPRRASEIQECIQDVRTELPPTADINAFCGCAVDKMQTGLQERPAMEQCAAQMGIQPRN